MKTLYLDCQAGISGDMTVAALLDLGVPLEHLQGELAKLALPADSYALSSNRTERHHMSAIKFDVEVHDTQTHRHYAAIDTMIEESGLQESVRERARRIFRRLAEAEAKVHNVVLSEVHFHEVGAIDSIVDIVGAAICLGYLQVERIFASSLPLGSGFVETAHGKLPVPAPATAELLCGIPVHGECGSGERVTPTGAAIIAALADGFGFPPAMEIEKIGSGAGGKDFSDVPNILRAFLCSSVIATEVDHLVVMEANIDDSSPEILGYALERLLAEGALDAWFTPIQMKKCRPAVMLSILCAPAETDKFGHIILEETSSIGIRHYPVSRLALERRIEERETRFGKVRFKVTGLGEKPEYEDCRKIAMEKGLPLREVYRILQSGESGE
jgi:pyridinium-3,5-bisthiocarboxylic acid mononucleotide nickel chelatase